jgi:hypothetical protein
LELTDIASAKEGRGGLSVPVTATDPPDSCTPAVEEVNELHRPFRVARPILDAWADQAHDERDEAQPGAWGGPEGALCRLLERAGPWRTVSVLGWAWQRASGRPANVWRHQRTGRLRVGPKGAGGFEFDEWVEVDDDEVQEQCGWPMAA